MQVERSSSLAQHQQNDHTEYAVADQALDTVPGCLEIDFAVLGQFGGDRRENAFSDCHFSRPIVVVAAHVNCIQSTMQSIDGLST
jgi:hypothetical protein